MCIDTFGDVLADACIDMCNHMWLDALLRVPNIVVINSSLAEYIDDSRQEFMNTCVNIVVTSSLTGVSTLL